MRIFSMISNLGEYDDEDIVDDITREEEGVDEASVLVAECLGSYCWLKERKNHNQFSFKTLK